MSNLPENPAALTPKEIQQYALKTQLIITETNKIIKKIEESNRSNQLFVNSRELAPENCGVLNKFE